MLQSLKNIFTNNNSIQAKENKEIDILSGLLIEAANTDGQITQDELNKISTSLINVFHEDAKKVEESLITALDNKDNSRSLYFYTSKLNKSFSDEKKIMFYIMKEYFIKDPPKSYVDVINDGYKDCNIDLCNWKKKSWWQVLLFFAEGLQF